MSRWFTAVYFVSGVLSLACQVSGGDHGDQAESRPARPEPMLEETVAEEHPAYTSIRAFKDINALELMKTYNAHSLGIRRRVEDGRETDEPALAFYVDPALAPTGESIPRFLEYKPSPDAAPVRIPTVVIESPAPNFEDAAAVKRPAEKED